MTILNNKVNLCDSCEQTIPNCDAASDDMIFGDGVGYDNVCACSKYRPTKSRMTKGEKFRTVFGFHPTGATVLYSIDENTANSLQIRWEDPYDGEME